MRTIGIRAEPKKVTFVIYDTSENAVINIEEIKVPKVLDFPEVLKYLRNNILDVISEYEVLRAGLRISEPTAKKTNIVRVQIEGVIQEALASSSVEAYFKGQVSNMSAKLGIDRQEFKKYIHGDLILGDIENWLDLSSIEKEAVCAAIGASYA
ncbi:hypothetical protein SAMN04487880_3447 [Marinobacter sp. es.042]|uniref:hypothetical protein n=1 Tax=Marinobacter sp. es.042 TaxID=1761794 RepID=UPI000B50FBFA|nr:hypothetical protein [Marinobacter sp. es.042]SNB59169.1 hypothetical protein SAMN04487880_3447 [Marinobacter sp. es.042]